MGNKKKQHKRAAVLALLLLVILPVVLFVLMILLQFGFAHRKGYFVPGEVVCKPLLGWFTMEERLVSGAGPELADLQPGDILLTLSTHSLGWRHGHVGLVIDENTTLESVMLGENSDWGDPQIWRSYGNFFVLRVKNVTPEERKAVAEYAADTLYDIPYHLSAGWIGEKAPATDAKQFGLHCSYLVWYAWKQFGYDLDADGGRLVTAADLLASPLLEIVQEYGMDPEKIKKLKNHKSSTNL